MIKIRDVGLIASLYSHGFEATEITQEGNQIFFIFEESQELKGAITLYNVGRLEVNAKINNDWYKRILYEIKSRLKNEKMLNETKDEKGETERNSK